MNGEEEETPLLETATGALLLVTPHPRLTVGDEGDGEKGALPRDGEKGTPI